MIQWIGAIVAVLGLVYTGVKDYQKGEIKFPKIDQNQGLTKTKYPIQYCLMAYDPNINKVFYLHENGMWYDYAPEQRRYSASPQYYQNQNQATMGTPNGTQGRSQGYVYGQQAQAIANPQRY